MMSSHTLLDTELIHCFIKDSIQGKEVLLANTVLQAQRMFDRNQLIGKTDGVLLTATFDRPLPTFQVRVGSRYWNLITETLAKYQFLPTGDIDGRGFHTYRYCKIPEQYQLNCTSTTVLWRNWWKYHHKINRSPIPLELLIRNRETWYPIKDVSCAHGFIYIQTLGSRLDLTINDRVIWLNKRSIKLLETGQAVPPQPVSGVKPDFRSTAWSVERPLWR